MKNILAENMRRFGTKNLAEGWGDVYKLATYGSEFKTILTPGQSEPVINRTIDLMIQDMGGLAEAAELMQGALESVDRIKGILKPLIAKDAKLDVTMLNKIVDRLPFDDATKKQLKYNIMKLAQDLKVGMVDDQPKVDADTSTGPKLA
jgi:hypothetical protein